MTRVDVARQFKIERLAQGHAPRVLELCSGCGGLSLGLKSAGFELLAHVESDPTAAKTYALNLGARDARRASAWAAPRDMSRCTPATLMDDFGLVGRPSQVFDVLAAGLPCQAFARIGRSKLRSIEGDERAFKKDPRAKLYKRFLEYVRETRPLAVLIENVPDILNFGGHNVPEDICITLDRMGYRSAYTLLNAAYYGVPQLRERVILIGLHRSLDASPRFPVPTHHIDLPRGYEGSRTVALKHVAEEGSHFVEIPEPDDELPPAVSVRSALADLPFISEHFADPQVMRRRRVAEELPYRTVDSLSVYARSMRNWRQFSTKDWTDGHVVRLTPRDFPIFQHMPRGSDYPAAVAVAEDLFEKKLRELLAAGARVSNRSRRYERLWDETVPPYDSEKFPNKWWKFDPLAPSRTLTAHLGKDTYSHIHYDGRQKRTISVREAARLQSFPDGFRFAGEMNAAFRQIGNAVPPLLAAALGAVLRQSLVQAARKQLKRLSAA